MKKYLMIAAAAVAALALVSCNQDPEAGGGGGGDKTPVVFETTDATTICINEVNGGDGYKGIELYNPTDNLMNLEGYTILKNSDEGAYWTGGASDYIPSKGFLVIRANKSTAELDLLGTVLSINKATGGLSGKKIVKLELKDNLGVSLDVFDRGWTKHWDGTNEYGLEDAGTNSFARQQDGKKTWKVMAPTFGATNAGANVVGDIIIDPE